MLYSDGELKDWWGRLTHQDRLDLLNKMVDICGEGFASSLLEWYLNDKPMSPKQLAAIRKWDREC